MHPYGTDDPSHERVPVLLAVIAIAVTAAFAFLARTQSWEVPFWVETPSVMGVYGLARLAFDHTLWRWFSRGPDLAGEWVGTVRSSHNDTEVRVHVRIQQTWSRIVVRLDAPGSTSRSKSAAIESTDTDEPTLRARV